MAEWVDRDHAIELRTEAMVLLVSDNGGGQVKVIVSPTREGVVLVEPVIEVRESGFVVDLEARALVGARR